MNKRRSIFNSRFILLFLLSCILAFPVISQGVDMFGWFKKEEVFLGSDVNGVVTEHGKPVVNLKVIRKLTYIDEKVHRDEAITDSTGHFHFPQKSTRSSLPNKLFSENRVWQEIFIDKEGTLIPFWVATQYGIKETPEYAKKLASLNCELTNKRVAFEFRNNNNEHRNHVASSICRWDADYIPFLLYDGDKEYLINDGDFNDLTERKIPE